MSASSAREWLNARQVRHHGEAEFLLQHRRHLGGALPGAAAGAVGDGHKVGPDPLQHRGGLAQRLDAGIILRREKFQRAQRALLRKELGDGPVGLHGRINGYGFVDTCKGKKIAIGTNILDAPCVLVPTSARQADASRLSFAQRLARLPLRCAAVDHGLRDGYDLLRYGAEAFKGFVRGLRYFGAHLLLCCSIHFIPSPAIAVLSDGEIEVMRHPGDMALLEDVFVNINAINEQSALFAIYVRFLLSRNAGFENVSSRSLSTSPQNERTGYAFSRSLQFIKIIGFIGQNSHVHACVSVCRRCSASVRPLHSYFVAYSDARPLRRVLFEIFDHNISSFSDLQRPFGVLRCRLGGVSSLDRSASGLLGFFQAPLHELSLQSVNMDLRPSGCSNSQGQSDIHPNPPWGRRVVIALLGSILFVWSVGLGSKRWERVCFTVVSVIYFGGFILFALTLFRWSWNWWL